MAEYFSRKTFGVLIDWMTSSSSYQQTLLKGIRSYAEENDINLAGLVVGRLNTPYNWERPRDFLYKLMENQDLYDGFIVLSTAISNFSGIAVLEKKLANISFDYPLVTIAGKIQDYPDISIDNATGFRELITHTLQFHSYKNPVYVSGPTENHEAQIRLQVFKDIMRENGRKVSESGIFFGNYMNESGKRAVVEILDKRKLHPDVIICANDSMAIGVFQELWERKIKVPEDIAVTGFDDLSVSEYLDLPFTTVRQPFLKQGYMAAQTLDEMIQGKEVNRNITLPTEVVYRKSCGCHRNNAETYFSLAKSNTEEIISQWKIKIKQNLKKEQEGMPGEPLLRCWNSILLDALQLKFKQLDMTDFLKDIQHQLKVSISGDNEQSQTLLERINQMFNDIFVQADLLNRLNESEEILGSMNAIDSFGHEALLSNSLNGQLEGINNILRTTHISDLYFSAFKGKKFDFEGQSQLLYYCLDFKTRDMMSQSIHFQTSHLIPRKYLPKNRFELVIQGLYEAEEHLGLLIMSFGGKGLDTYEMLRRRFSYLMRAVETHQDLKLLYDRLKKEVAVREETERKLKRALETVQNLSLTDELTGLYNRRGFMTLAGQQLKNCLREETPFVIFYIDLDGLKLINDRHGHKEGDFAILMTAEILNKTLREIDIISRLGGDEFTIFARTLERRNLDLVLTRLESEVQSVNASIKKPYTLSMSIGTYIHDINTETPQLSLSEMMERADQNLYKVKKAKKAGN